MYLLLSNTRYNATASNPSGIATGHVQAGWTALMWTCYKGRTEAASILLSHGANPNVKGEVKKQEIHSPVTSLSYVAS